MIRCAECQICMVMELPEFIKSYDFSRMCEQYRIWNERINVISRKDIDNVWEHHILHSLGIALYLQSQMPDEFARWRSIYAATGCQDPNCVAIGPSHRFAAGPSPSVRPGLARGLDDPAAASDCVTVLDVGCGGGFPGIPLAAVFPDVQFTLCDSIGKKVRVASEVAAALGLRNVECIHSRVEDLPSSRRWDWVVSRAVTSLDNFLPWVRGRYTSGILYLKGGDISEELEACRRKFGHAGDSNKEGATMSSVSTWPLSSVLDDPYYAEKLVVHLG